MPGYARGLQNPDYAPNYAIMPEHNGEDPMRNPKADPNGLQMNLFGQGRSCVPV